MALWLRSVDVVASIASLVRYLLAGFAKSPAALEVTERKEVKQQFAGAPDTSGQSLALFGTLILSLALKVLLAAEGDDRRLSSWTVCR